MTPSSRTAWRHVGRFYDEVERLGRENRELRQKLAEAEWRCKVLSGLCDDYASELAKLRPEDDE